MSDESLSRYTIVQLRDELSGGGLKIFAETAWGWSELKPAIFIRQLEKDGSDLIAYTELRTGGQATLKVPRRV